MSDVERLAERIRRQFTDEALPQHTVEEVKENFGDRQLTLKEKADLFRRASFGRGAKKNHNGKIFRKGVGEKYTDRRTIRWSHSSRNHSRRTS